MCGGYGAENDAKIGMFSIFIFCYVAITTNKRREKTKLFVKSRSVIFGQRSPKS